MIPRYGRSLERFGIPGIRSWPPPRPVRVVLWGARKGDLQFGSPEDLRRAELARSMAVLIRQARVFRLQMIDVSDAALAVGRTMAKALGQAFAPYT